MSARIGVVAHAKKSLGGGLPELRSALARRGCTELAWYEVPKSRKAPKAVRKALAEGIDLLLVWGGDGTVQRCVDTISQEKAGGDVAIGLLPAGTANLLARNLGVPIDLEPALDVALSGERRALDTGSLNGEHFVVMAGAGLDALMIRDADGGLKDKLGRAAYVWTGAKNVHAASMKAKVTVDGRPFFAGKASCLLAGNIEKILGGLSFFDDVRSDDGLLDFGVVTATTYLQWARTAGRVAVGRAERSPFVEVTKGRRIDIELKSKVPVQLDGGDRDPVKKLRIEVQPAAVTVCVPSAQVGTAEAAHEASG